MSLASVDELSARLEWVLSPEETRLAAGALEELSEQALFYGKTTWDATTTPRLVKNTVLAAAARFMRNPDGYTTSRAGDETLSWTDRHQDAGAAFFNDREVKMIRALAGSTGIFSAPITAWGPQATVDAGYVPVEGPGKPFPFFSSDTSPW